MLGLSPPVRGRGLKPETILARMSRAIGSPPVRGRGSARQQQYHRQRRVEYHTSRGVLRHQWRQHKDIGNENEQKQREKTVAVVWLRLSWSVKLGLKQAHTKDEMREDLEAQVLTKSAGAPEGSLSIFGSD